MRNKNARLTNQRIYMFVACLYYVSLIISSSNIENIIIPVSEILSMVRYISFGLLLMLWLYKNKRITVRNIGIIAVCATIVAAIYIQIDNADLVVLLMFIITGKDINTKQLSDAMYKTGFIVLLIIVVLFMTRTISSGVSVRADGRTGMTFGFVGANAMANIVFVNLIYFLYSHKDIWNRKYNRIYLSISFIVFAITKTRMAFLLEIILITSFVLARKYNSIRKLIYNTSVYIYGICACMTFAMAEWYCKGSYTDPIRNACNLLTSGRLYWISYFKDEYGYTFWGQRINLIGVKMAASGLGRWQSIDNAYALLGLYYGFALIILFAILYFSLGKMLKKQGNYTGCILIIIMSLWGLTENTILQIGFNMTFFLMAVMISGRKNKLYFHLNQKKEEKYA